MVIHRISDHTIISYSNIIIHDVTIVIGVKRFSFTRTQGSAIVISFASCSNKIFQEVIRVVEHYCRRRKRIRRTTGRTKCDRGREPQFSGFSSYRARRPRFLHWSLEIEFRRRARGFLIRIWGFSRNARAFGETAGSGLTAGFIRLHDGRKGWLVCQSRWEKVGRLDEARTKGRDHRRQPKARNYRE